MTEYIKKADVEQCMNDSFRNSGIPAEARKKFQKWLDKAPAADVTERKKGKWIRHLSDRFGAELNDCIECNCCGVWFSSDEMLRRSFCPNCGADMKEES